MKNLRLPVILALTMVFTLAATASAQTAGLYITPKIGYSHLQTDAHEQLSHTTLGTIYESANGRHGQGQAVLGLAVGYDFNPVYDVPLRTEFEYAWRGKEEKFNETWTPLPVQFPGWNVTEKGKVGVQSFFVNTYFDIHNSSRITPYISAGLGVAAVSGDYQVSGNDGTWLNMSASKTNFAWNVGAGAAWALTDRVSLDLGYRYADFGSIGHVVADSDLGLQFSADSDITTHEVLLGLRYTF